MPDLEQKIRKHQQRLAGAVNAEVRSANETHWARQALADAKQRLAEKERILAQDRERIERYARTLIELIDQREDPAP